MSEEAQRISIFGNGQQIAIQGWVRDVGLGSTVTDFEPLTGGTQNIVARIHVDGSPMVLRRPPLHPRPSSNKTMLREIAALRTLAGTTVPHPAFIAGCEDLSVLGVVFYLMEEVDGFNPGSEVAEAYVLDVAMRHQVGLSYAANLAELGNVAWQGKPLSELRRPGSFLERQVAQFLRLLESYRHNGYEPQSFVVNELAEWLHSNRPPDGVPGILHGDPHLSNTLLRRDKPEVAAFVDWEMCTVGDPLLDLGWMLVCWPLDTHTITAGAELAAAGGLASRRELLDAYVQAGGRETSSLNWYVAVACFKLAIVIEGTWSRSLAGQASDEEGERLHEAALELIELGTRVARGDNPLDLDL